MKKIIFLIAASLLYSSAALAFAAKNVATEQTILRDINLYRLQHNLVSLEMNDYISEVAREHSKDMAEHNYMGHAKFAKRMQLLLTHFKRAQGVAENVAFTEFKVTTVTELWLHSSGHRKNIAGKYNLTGIGCVDDSKGGHYVTQIFVSTY